MDARTAEGGPPRPRTAWSCIVAALALAAALATLALVLQPSQPHSVGAGVRRQLRHTVRTSSHLRAAHRQRNASGFYVHPLKGEYYTKAKQAGTGKIIIDATYHSIFEQAEGRTRVHKMLEIGLGCNVESGPGKSAILWRTYMPAHTEIWFAEYDAPCVEQHRDKLHALNVKAVTGDQGDPATVYRWIDETGGDFDFIADDGGHGNDQMYTSFIILFQHALKPGGVYVIEDLCAARIAGYQGGPWITKTVIIDAIKDWIEGLLTNYFQTMEQKAELAYEIKHKMPPGIKSISCANCACAVVKCFADDPECDYGARVDHSLVNYGKV